MIRQFVVFAAVASSFACPPQIAERCGDALPPCSAGFVCVAGLCARAESDGGSLDASVRSDAGATDAGRVAECDGGCAPWAVCVASTTSAACVNARLEVTAPLDATTLRAGQSVAVSARVLLVDGGAWPNTLAIPVQASWGPQTMLLNGIAGSVAGLSDAGQGVVVFGWDGGPVESRDVAFSACSAEVVASCDPFMECAPSSTGGLCVSHGYVVEWVSPDAGSATNQASVPAEIRVSKPDAGVVTLTSIPVTGATAFTGAAGRYIGVLPITAPDGIKMFTAGWPTDGATSTLSIERDTIAPSVSVVVEPRNGPDPDPLDPIAWKLDERALVQVVIDGGRPAQLSDFIVPDGGLVVVASGCQGCQGQCRCFEVDLSRGSLAGIRGTKWIQVNRIADVVGNESLPVDAGVRLTRALWARDISIVDAGTILFPVAVSETGHVVAALESRPGVASRVAVFTQRGVSVAVPAVTTSVSSGPTVIGSTVWVGQHNAGQSSLVPIVIQGPPQSPVCAAMTNRFRPDLAVLSLDGGAVPLAVGDNGLMMGTSSCPSYAIPSAVDSRVSLVVNQQNAASEAFLHTGTLYRVALDGGAWVGAGSISESTLGTGRPRSMFVDGVGNVGSAGGEGISVGFVALVRPQVQLDDSVSFAKSSELTSAASVADDRVFGFSLLNAFVAKNYDSSFGTFSAQDRLSSFFLSGITTPVLGAGGLLYIVGGRTPAAEGAAVGVLRQSDLSTVWSDSFPGFSANAVFSEAALDVYRSSSGGKDCSKSLGVFYVLVSNGVTASLRAILVDSNGLDPTAPWPKFQRDNANRGNISLPTTPWTCP